METTARFVVASIAVLIFIRQVWEEVQFLACYIYEQIEWAWSLDISDLIITFSVVVALILGVGNWLYDSKKTKRIEYIQKRSCVFLFQNKVVNLNIHTNEIKRSLDKVFVSSSIDVSERRIIRADIFSSSAGAFILPVFLNQATAMNVAAIVPFPIIEFICKIDDMVRAWNTAVDQLSHSNTNEFSPELQDNLYSMLVDLKDTLNDCAPVMETESGYRFTSVPERVVEK